MRILRMDSWDGQPGGAQEYVRSVSDLLAAAGHPQRIVNVVSEPPQGEPMDERIVRVPASGARRRYSDLAVAPEFERVFSAEVEQFRPDLVHLHHFDGLFGPIARSVARLQVPVVFTAHDSELVCPISTLLRPGNIVCDGGIRPRCLFTGCHVGVGGPYNLWQTRVFDSVLRPRIRGYLCPSRRLTEYLDANGYRPAVHLPPFVRLPPEVVAAPYGPPESPTPLVGYLGRLEPYKGVHVLLEALARLGPEHRAVELEIAGDGPFRPALERVARQFGVEGRVRFLGDLRGEAKERWFRRVHVVVVPSTAWENLGFVAIEALARGRPVIATNFGGLPDVVQDGESGRLVPVGDPSALALALGQTIADPELGARWAAEGRRRVLDTFAADRHVERLLSIYRLAVGGKPLLPLPN